MSIIDSIYQTLSISKETRQDSLQDSMTQLVKQGRQLVADILRTDPPGKFVGYEKEAFDGLRHEAMSGYMGNRSLFSSPAASSPQAGSMTCSPVPPKCAACGNQFISLFPSFVLSCNHLTGQRAFIAYTSILSFQLSAVTQFPRQDNE